MDHHTQPTTIATARSRAEAAALRPCAPATSGYHYRSDRGRARGADAALIERCAALVLDEFLADPAGLCPRSHRPRGIMQAVQRVCQQMAGIGITLDPMRLYRYIIGHGRRSIFYTQDWASQWMRRWRKHDAAISSACVRYAFWEIAESDFECGEHKGGYRFIAIDDRQSKIYLDHNGQLQKMTMLVAWDILTGELLYLRTCDTLTTQDYVRAILEIIIRFGIDRTTWFLENAAVAASSRLEQLIMHLYDEDDRQWFARRPYRLLFAGQGPIVRNVPGLPISIGKATAERFNQLLKWLDASIAPEAYMGSNRHESVQLTRSPHPVISASKTLPSSSYEELLRRAWEAQLDIIVPSMKRWGAMKGITPTRRNIIMYYKPDQTTRPLDQRLAYLLYYAQPRPPRRCSLYRRGMLMLRKNHQIINLVAPELYADYLTRKKCLSVLEMPWSPGTYAIYYHPDDQRVEYLCAARDATARSAQEAIDLRMAIRSLRTQDTMRLHDTNSNLIMPIDEIDRIIVSL